MALNKHRQAVGFLALIAALSVFWYLGGFLHIDAAYLKGLLQRFPLFLSGPAFILLYVSVSFFIYFSKDIFWIAAALIFGPFYSALFILAAELINAAVSFYLSRYLGRAYVAGSLKGKYGSLDARLGNISFFWLFIFRAAPLIPYKIMDLAAGLTKIRFKKYFAACLLGSPVKIFWIQYVLSGVGESALHEPKRLVDYFLGNRQLLMFGLIYCILVLAVFLKIRKIRG